jgi:hypothetical protein
MKSGTLYVRIVPQDRDRGYMMLVGYDPRVVQSTAMQYYTLNLISRAVINATLERIRASYSASEIRDVTPTGLRKKLAKQFGEEWQPDEV